MQVRVRHQINRHPSDRKRWPRIVLWVSVSVVGLLLATNVVMWVAYRQKVLPNVSLGAVPVGNIAYKDLDEKITIDRLLPSNITLVAGDKSQVLTPEALGLAVDWPATRERLKQERSVLPIFNLIRHRTVPLKLTMDQAKFGQLQTQLATYFSKDPLPERITFSGQNFEITPPEDGQKLDEAVFRDTILSAAQKGQRKTEVPLQVIAADPTTGGLDAELQALRKKLGAKITFNLQGQLFKPDSAEIGSWFVPDGRTMVFSSEKAKAYIASLGANLFNSTDAASAASYALDRASELTFMLVSTGASATYTYCAATKGVDQAHLPGFKAKVAAVLGDPRGWNAGGTIGFEKVESGCDFSIWLSAPSQMTSFGGLCDSYYSCRSGRNVVINFDRWQGATDPWNASGGSLEDYRVMVTNHEVGHWLGFGHANCSAPGQPAPVMQQQSISLQGCTFNPWPTAAEIASVQ